MMCSHRSTLPVLAIALVLLVGFVIGPNDAPPSREGAVAIINVNVVPMDSERVIEDQTVLIENDIIAEIGPADEVDVPEDILQIDGSDRYLMPGLAEMHGHLPGPDNEELREASLFLFAANGVTYVRGMQGAPDHPDLRDAIERGERVGPTLRVASPSFGGSDLSEEEARRRVGEYYEQGFDLLKVSEGLQPDVYDTIVDEANALGIPFAGHVSDEVGLMRSLEAGQQTIDHLDNYVEALRSDEAPAEYSSIFGAATLVPYVDEGQISEVVGATREAGAGVVPTLLLWETFFEDRPVRQYREAYPELAYMPEQLVENWANSLQNIREQVDPEHGQQVIQLRREILRRLHEAGVPVLLGSDAPQIFNVPGFSVHREMQLMQDIGLSPYDVLVSGTRAVAEFYGEADAFGTIAEGRRADLILVNGNPLEDVAHAEDIEAVLVNGDLISRAAIEARLEELARQSSEE